MTAWNFLEESSFLLREAAISFSGRGDLAKAVLPKIDRLAKVMGVAPGQLRELCCDGGADDSSPTDFFGTPLRAGQIDHNRRKLAPGALALSNHHRALWSVRALPFCNETWELLIDHCHEPKCGRPLKWLKAEGIDICEHCGADLKLAPTSKVPHEDRLPLAFMAGLLSPFPERRRQSLDQAHDDLRYLGAGALFDLALSFAAAATPTGLAPAIDEAPQSNYSRTRTGGRMLMGYPATIEAIATTGSSDNAIMPSFFRRLRRLNYSAAVPGVERAAIDLVEKYEGIERSGVLRLKIKRERRGALTLVETARRLKIENAKVRALVDRGVLRSSGQRGHERYLHWFWTEEVEAVATTLAGRISPQAFGSAHGIPPRVVDELIIAGLLRINTAPAVSLVYSGPQLEKASCDTFVASLRAVLIDDQAEAEHRVPLSQTIAGLGPGEIPWMSILSAALENRLPGGIYSPNRQVDFGLFQIISDLHVGLMLGSLEERRLHLASRHAGSGASSAVRRSEAESYLRCPPNDLSLAVRAGHITSLGGTPTLYSRSDVEDFATSHISTREISHRTGLRTYFVTQIAVVMGMERVIGGFWRRQEFDERVLAFLNFPTEKRMRTWVASRPFAPGTEILSERESRLLGLPPPVGFRPRA